MSPYRAFLAIWWLCYADKASSDNSATLSFYEVTRLHEVLFANYSQIRPALTWTEAVDVYLTFSLFQVKSLDGKSQIFETIGQLQMVWWDFQLSWTPSEYGGVEFMDADVEVIWTPIVGLRNSAQDVIDVNWRKNFPATVYHNGIVSWTPIGSFQSTCELNMFKFPFDTQECSLDFGNLIHADDTVNLTTFDDAVFLKFYLESNEFSVSSGPVTSDSYILHLDTTILRIPVISFWLHLKRLHGYYLLNIIIPCAVLAVLSAFIFYVPVDSGEKLSLAITILLSFTVFLLILSDNTPHTSGPLPFLGIYITVTICISAVSIIVQMIILNMYHQHLSMAVPRWLSKFARALTWMCGPCRGILPISAASPDGKRISETDDVVIQDLDRGTIKRWAKNDKKDFVTVEEMKDEWRAIAFILDHFFFFLFVIVQVLMVLVTFCVLPYV